MPCPLSHGVMGLGLERFSAPCNKYRNPHVLRNEDSAHFLASFCYGLKSWWDDRARENWAFMRPFGRLPAFLYCVSTSSSANATLTFWTQMPTWPPPPKKKVQKTTTCWFLLFATMRLCAAISCVSFVDCWSSTYFWPGGPNAASLCLGA